MLGGGAILCAGCMQPASGARAGAKITVKSGTSGIPSNTAGTLPPRAESSVIRLRPGYVMDITVLVAGKTEIDAKTKRISDSGTITLPLLGVVDVNQMTLDTLQSLLEFEFGKYLVKPQVIVDFVRDEHPDGSSPWGSVTVLGRVKKQGRISIPPTRDLTVSGAIQQAGGLDTSARDTAIRVSHRRANGEIETKEVNLKAVGSRGQLEEDSRLESDDVVFVPELMF